MYATLRMLIQLLLIGYVLIFIFDSDDPGIILAALVIMLVVASWIAIRPLQHKPLFAYLSALGAISVGGILTLVLVSQAVIDVQPWFSPRYVVPLAGMIFAGSMNAVSLAAKYQIVVMTMLFGASGVSAALYLVLEQRGQRLQSRRN